MSEKFNPDFSLKISASNPLNGSVHIDGAKNSALRLLAASILTPYTIKLENYPSKLLDCQVHVEMLSMLGKKIEILSDDKISISEDAPLARKLDWKKRSIRNTLLILGALVGRFHEGYVPLPGGCKLGDRKYDIHVMLLEKLGAVVSDEDDFLYAKAENGLIGTDIYLPIRSTGATENGIILGTLAKGITRIWNPHIRPEIIDLIDFLNSIGANIKVYGQEHIEINGVEGLTGGTHRVIPDNMEAITWLVAAAITGGTVEINNFPHKDLEVVLTHLKAAGAKLYSSDDSVIIKGCNCYPVEISTGPHPGINSDVQPILASWAVKAKGESRIIDLRFPGRYGYAHEMKKLGVNYSIDGDMLKIYGTGGVISGGATVKALDLRAGAALSLCGLLSQEEIIITDAWQIMRGYVDFDKKLRSLGANIEVI